MSDSVIDIIHKITYETNEDVILSLNKAFGNQFKQLQDLYTEQKRLEDLREKSANQDIATQTALNTAYSKNKQAIDNITLALGKEFAANEKLQGSIAKTGKNLTSLSFAGSQLLREAPAFTYSIQTGILALSNNIPILLDQLSSARKAGATTTEIFKSLGSSIFGLTGLITIAVSVLTIFGDKLFRSGEAAKEAKDEYQKFLEAVNTNTKQALKSTDEQIGKEKTLLGILKSKTATEEQRTKALKELRASFPSLGEGEVSKDNLRLLEQQIAAKERSNALSKDVVLTKEQILAKDAEIAKQQKEVDAARIIALNSQNYAQVALGDRQEFAISEAVKKQKELEKAQQKLNDLEAGRAGMIVVSARLQKTATEEAIKSGDVFFGKLQEDKSPTKIGKAIKELDTLEFKMKESVINLEKLFKLIQDVDDKSNPNSSNFLGRFSQTPIRGTVKVNDPILPEDKEQKRKEDLEKQKEYYIDAFNLTIQGLQSIYDAKLRYYDMELSAQQSRIEQATLLAERGNASVLEDELNSMRTLETERERVVQSQVQLNALLQASQTALAAASAIQTIAAAGTLSGPAAPVVIAATVAALAAGFATISGLVTAFRGFKTGGYTGDGDTSATAGMVHGKEFVITADKTAKYRPLLEAIHTGTIEKAYPTYNNYASRTEMKETNKRLDTLIELATFDKTEVKNMVSGGDLVTVTTKHSQRNRNRFKR